LIVNLRHLNLSENEIESLPAEFGSLVNLVELNLEGNKLAVREKEKEKEREREREREREKEKERKKERERKKEKERKRMKKKKKLMIRNEAFV